MEGYGQGDQLVHVNVWTPKKLSPDEKEALEALRQSPNFQPVALARLQRQPLHDRPSSNL